MKNSLYWLDGNLPVIVGKTINVSPDSNCDLSALILAFTKYCAFVEVCPKPENVQLFNVLFVSCNLSAKFCVMKCVCEQLSINTLASRSLWFISTTLGHLFPMIIRNQEVTMKSIVNCYTCYSVRNFTFSIRVWERKSGTWFLNKIEKLQGKENTTQHKTNGTNGTVILWSNWSRVFC